MNQTTVLDKKDRDELVDFSIRLGQLCWNVYCESKVGFVRVFMLPNADVRRRANELFHLGFSARMIICPPIGIPALDAVTETPLGEKMWESYLDTMNGKVAPVNARRPTGAVPFEGEADCDETASFLRYAKEFFLEGFRAGTIAVREIMNS